jgi:hypothetical protein
LFAREVSFYFCPTLLDLISYFNTAFQKASSGCYFQ